MIKVIVFAPPGMSVSLEREGVVSAEDFKALQQTVTNLSSGYSNIQNWITQHQNNHSVDWVNGITNKPTTFPPSAHTHTWADIDGKPTTFPPSAHTHTMADITNLSNRIAETGHLTIGDIADTAYSNTVYLSGTYPMLAENVPSYMVLGCLRTTNAASVSHDDSIWQIFDPTPTSFGVTVRTVDSSDVQRLIFDYAILLLN